MSNFYIKLEGQIIDMPPGQSITLERFNPFFDFETIQGSRVNDFEVPFSPKTDALFNWYGGHQSSFENKKMYCEKYCMGQLIEKGYVQLADVTETGYQIFFTQNLGDFLGEFQNTLMNLIDFGSQPINYKADYDYLTDAFAYPTCRNSGFYGTVKVEGFADLINEVGNEAAPKVPMIGLRFIFDKLAILLNVKFAGDFFYSDWFKAGLIENLFSLDGMTEVSVQNHLWALSIPEFIKELGKLLNYQICINTPERIIYLIDRNAILTESVSSEMNFTSKVMPNPSRKPEKASRMQLDWAIDSNDLKLKVLPSEFLKYQTNGTPDQGFFDITTKISTRITEDGLACAEQLGISDKVTSGNNTFTPKILFWNGVINGLPTATNSINGNNLAWNGSNSLSTVRYGKFEQWRKKTASRVVKARLTPTDLTNMDYHQNGGKNVIIHIHGRNYLVANIRINLPIVSYATMEVWEV